MSPTAVELVFDSGPSIGFGHMRRMTTLSEALRDIGITSSLTNLSAEPQELLWGEQLGTKNSRVVVFDVPQGIDSLMQSAKASGCCVVALDWFGETEPDVAIVIYAHRPVRARYKTYVGLEYLLIRSEITSQPVKHSGEGIVIMLGGGDLLDQGHSAALRLAEQNLNVTLIRGPLAPVPNGLLPYDVAVTPKDLPERLANCSWIVTNGGGSMFEAMCLGKAAVSLPQTNAEMVLARYAYERGALLGIGMNRLFPRKIEETQSVAKRAAALVDGHGAWRVAEIIRSLI